MYNPPQYLNRQKSSSFPLKRKHSISQQQQSQSSSSNDNDCVPFTSLYNDERDFIFKKEKKHSDDNMFQLNKQPHDHLADNNHLLHFDYSDSDINYGSQISTPQFIPIHENQYSIEEHHLDLNINNIGCQKSENQCYKRKLSQQYNSQCSTRKVSYSKRSDYTKQFKDALKKYNFKMVQKLNIYSESQPVQVKCQFNHILDVSLEQLNSDYVNSICEECNHVLEQVNLYAQQKEGILHTTVLQDKLSFECSRNHFFQMKLSDYKSHWCQQCKKIYKQEFKQYLKQEEEIRQQEYIEKQEELYKNARKHYKRSYCASASESEDNSAENQKGDHPDYEQVIEAEKVVEKQISELAHKKAVKYIQEHKDSEEKQVSQIEAEEVYKMIMFPEEVLNCYFDVLSSYSLKKVYRKFARHIHPDKNHHPQSSIAFQKLSQAYHKYIDKKQN